MVTNRNITEWQVTDQLLGKGITRLADGNPSQLGSPSSSNKLAEVSTLSTCFHNLLNYKFIKNRNHWEDKIFPQKKKKRWD